MRYFIFILLICCNPEISAAQIPEECTSDYALVSVSHIKTASAEKIIFEFIGEAPSIKLTTIKPPFREDPSDRLIKVKGERFKEITFMSTSWVCTIKYHVKSITGATKVMGFKNAGQFEGYFTYILGYRKTAKVAGPVVSPDGKNKKVIITIR
jgi:hypothetical protein